MAPVPLTANMVSRETEKRMMARKIDGNVEILAAIKPLSLVNTESVAAGKNEMAATNAMANKRLAIAIFFTK